MNPSIGDVAAQAIEVRVEGGATLPGRVWVSPAPRALVAVVHGVGEHSGRYAALASDLVRASCTVVALDLPGHGEAPGARGDMPSWIGIRDHVIPAMFTATLGIPGQPERLSRIVLGHSMGGVLALDYVLAHPKGVAAAVASAPGLRSAIPPWWKLALANVARATAPSLGFPTGLGDGGMSRDPEVLRLRKEDPLMHDRISPRLYFAFNEGRQRVLRDARRLQVPTLVLHGEADSVVDPAGSREFAVAAPRGMAKLITYPDAYHEIFNDPARAQAVPDLSRWLSGVVARG